MSLEITDLSIWVQGPGLGCHILLQTRGGAAGSFPELEGASEFASFLVHVCSSRLSHDFPSPLVWMIHQAFIFFSWLLWSECATKAHWLQFHPQFNGLKGWGLREVARGIYPLLPLSEDTQCH